MQRQGWQKGDSEGVCSGDYIADIWGDPFLFVCFILPTNFYTYQLFHVYPICIGCPGVRVPTGGSLSLVECHVEAGCEFSQLSSRTTLGPLIKAKDQYRQYL